MAPGKETDGCAGVRNQSAVEANAGAPQLSTAQSQGKTAMITWTALTGKL